MQKEKKNMVEKKRAGLACVSLNFSQPSFQKYKRGIKYRWKIPLLDRWSSLKRDHYREGYCYFDA